MSETEKIKAIAELDGWKFSHMGSDQGIAYPLGDDPDGRRRELPPYLTSLDAIVPVCLKQPREILLRIIARTTIASSPHEIAIILLEESRG